MNSGTVLDLYWDWSPMETGSPFQYRNDFLVSLVLMSISPVSTKLSYFKIARRPCCLAPYGLGGKGL